MDVNWQTPNNLNLTLISKEGKKFFMKTLKNTITHQIRYRIFTQDRACKIICIKIFKITTWL